MNKQNDVSLARYTTWKVGGAAKSVFKPKDISELQAILKQLPEDEGVVFLGLGSNSLILSGGLDATVILMGHINKYVISTEQGALLRAASGEISSVYAEAGLACASLARRSARNALTNIEFLAGIPGTVGGALAMNAGCHGSEIWDFVEYVETIDREGVIHKRAPEELEVGYRFARNFKEEWFIGVSLSVTLSIKEECQQKIKQLLQHRQDTQPINLPNGGCAFRNPPNDYAGRLIEESGLKGFRIGGAQVSEKHANFIVIVGEATPEDVEDLVEHVEATVLSKTGVRLLREVKIMGTRK